MAMILEDIAEQWCWEMLYDSDTEGCCRVVCWEMLYHRDIQRDVEQLCLEVLYNSDTEGCCRTAMLAGVT